jgi:hypothetical protein
MHLFSISIMLSVQEYLVNSIRQDGSFWDQLFPLRSISVVNTSIVVPFHCYVLSPSMDVNYLINYPLKDIWRKGPGTHLGQGSTAGNKFGNYSFLEPHKHTWLGFSKLPTVKAAGAMGPGWVLGAVSRASVLGVVWAHGVPWAPHWKGSCWSDWLWTASL